MRLTERNVAVTGGAGFIGSHLVDRLLARHNRVVVYDNLSTGSKANLARHAGSSSLRWAIGDVRDLGALEEALKGIEVVFHLATHCVRLSLTQPVINHEVNATGTLNALIAARRNGVRRFIYCSSSEVYGNGAFQGHPEGAVLGEESPLAPTTVYGATKLIGEYYTLVYHRTHELPSMVIRPFNTYGPRSHLMGPYGEVIPRFVTWVRAGMPPVILGDGLQTRDFTYVEDTAAAMVDAAERDELLGDTLVAARGEEVSILELARTICELHGRACEPRFLPERPGDIRRLGSNPRRFHALFPDRPWIPLREGLRRYLAWLDLQNLDYPELARGLEERNWLGAGESA